MTHREIFDIGVGGSGAIKQIIDILAANGEYCLIGGMAINCYCSPLYTADSDFAIASSNKDAVKAAMKEAGMKVKAGRYYMSVFIPNSKLTIHITTDERYKDFGKRAEEKMIFEEFPVKVASLEDLVKGKTWCFEDPCRKLEKRLKDQLDLVRMGTNYPELMKQLPKEIQEIMEKENSQQRGMEL